MKVLECDNVGNVVNPPSQKATADKGLESDCFAALAMTSGGVKDNC